MDLPITNFTANKANEVEISFYGRVPVLSATSLLFYNRRGNVQKLIHQLKYKNQQQIGSFLGNWLGEEMFLSGRFKAIDFIVPVPLHPRKIKKRGYNQVTTFGASLSEKLMVPYVENKLISVSKSNTQTLKSRLERSVNVEEKFQLADHDFFKNKHVLLIDDVITTGATLEACCIALMRSDNVTISIATMAFTA
jgi:ComF family protein